MKTATKKYLTLKSFDHYGCIALPLSTTPEGLLNCWMIYCKHKGNHRLLVKREEI